MFTASKENKKNESSNAVHSGNGAFFRPVQPKLSINQPNDMYEQEADAMADKVMRMQDPNPQPFFTPAITPVQRKCAHCEEEEKKMQRKESNNESPVANAATENYINSLPGRGRSLTAEEKNFFEPRFGYDFSNVQLHTNAEANESAKSINALAYTYGDNIVFGSNQYQPNTDAGKKLMAHELTHVVQQNTSIQRKIIQRAENDTAVGCTPLTDTRTDVNAYVNSALSALRPASGAAMVSGMRGGIGSDMWTSPGRTQIEGWASGLPATKAFLPAQSATKYNGVNYVLWATRFPILNPTMKVNGICIGSDKLGHFFQQGHEYYVASHSSGGSVATAVAGGQRQEAGGYGLRTTGVYSNADLEANRKGMDFYNDLAASPGLTFDIATYINANWSEVNNPNYYEPSVGPIVWRNLLTSAWTGVMEDSTASQSRTVTANLTVAANNTSLTGTFTSSAGPGTLTGTVSHTTITPPGPVTTAVAVSGVTVNFDWVMGSASGKGIWTNVKENELHGTWGNGTSNSSRGAWNMSK
jgi:hypothetical protein